MSQAANLRAAIGRLTQCVTTRLPLHEQDEALASEALKLTGASRAAVCRLIEGGSLVHFAAVVGANAEQIVGSRVRTADSLSRTVIETGTGQLFHYSELAGTGSLFHNDTTATGVSSDSRVTVETWDSPVRSAAVVPLFEDTQLVGTLVVQNKIRPDDETETRFDKQDLDLLAVLADFASNSALVNRLTQVVCEQHRELAVLYDASQSVSGNLNVQQVLDNVLTSLSTHIEHHTIAVFLLNDERTHLFIAGERGLTPDERDCQLSVEAGIYSRCLQSGSPTIINDIETIPDFLDFSERAHPSSAMLTPIKSRNETLGLIQITSVHRGAYSSSDQRMLFAIAMQAGVAIENAWLYEQSQRQAFLAGALFDLSQQLNSNLDVDTVLGYVADRVSDLLNTDRFAVMLYDAKSDRLIPRAVRGMGDETLELPKIRPGEGIAGWVYDWQTPQAVSNVGADPRNRTAPLDRFGVASVLCVPMHVGEQVVGVVLAMTTRRRLFTVGEMELLYTISNQAAVATSNAQQYRAERSRSHEMSRHLRRIAHALGSSLDGASLPQIMSDLSMELLRADRCAVYAVGATELRLRASSKFKTSGLPGGTIPYGQGFAGWVARKGQPLKVINATQDPRWRPQDPLQKEHVASYLGVPLKVGRRTVAVIEMWTLQPRDFTDEEVQLLSTFVRRARMADHLMETSS